MALVEILDEINLTPGIVGLSWGGSGDGSGAALGCRDSGADEGGDGR